MSAIRSRPLLAIFLIATAARAAYVLVARVDPLVGVDAPTYDQLARDLLAGNGLVDRIGTNRPPLYPLFVAACYAVGGIPVLQAVQLAISGATPVLVAILARELYWRTDGRLTWAAGLLAAFYPWFFQYAGTLASETLFTSLALGAFVATLRGARSPGVRQLLIAGVLFGLACLTRANLLVIGPFIGLWVMVRRREVLGASAMAAGVLLVLVPSVAYNVLQGNGPILVSNGGGVAFFVGNNPDAARLYDPRTPDDEWRRLNFEEVITRPTLDYLRAENMTEAEWRHLGRILIGPRSSELPYLACLPDTACEPIPVAKREAHFYAAAFRWIREDPGSWAVLEARKLVHAVRPWVEPRAYPTSVVVASGLSFAPVLLFAVIGLLRMPRSSATFVALIAIVATLTSVLYIVLLRYRFALVDPVLVAAAAGPAGDLVARAARRIRSAKPDSGPPAAASRTGSTSANR